jgi:transposase
LPYDPTEHRDSRGRFATPAHREQIREPMRVDYEGDDLLIREIADKYNTTGATVDRWARLGGWKRRQQRAIDPDDLIGRILALLSEQIADMETVMKNGAPEVAMLAKLVTTLDRVIALKERTGVNRPRSSRRVEELRAKIAERIGELSRA